MNLLPSSTGQGSTDRSPYRLLNLYASINSQDDKSALSLKGLHGSKLFFDPTDYGILSGDRIRGLHTTGEGRLFVVYNSRVFEVLSDAMAMETDYGIVPSASPVSMADNGRYLCVVDGSHLNVIDTHSVDLHCIAKIIPPSYVREISQFNERFFVISKDSPFVYWSGIGEDGVNNWDPLDFIKTTNGEVFQSIKATREYLWLFTNRSFYVYAKSTDPDMPLHQIGGSFGEVGVNGGVASIAERVFWLGSSSVGEMQVYMSEGVSARKISTQSIDAILHRATGDIKGFCYSIGGNSFYVLTIGDKTLSYDLSTGFWHERTTTDPYTGIRGEWSFQGATNWKGRVYSATARGNQIVSFDLDSPTEYDGRLITKLFQTPPVWQGLNYVFHKRLILDIDVEKWEDTARLMMQMSDDGGNTWGNERVTEIGGVGEYAKRIEFNRLGRSRERVYRLSTSDPIKLTINGVRLDATEGAR